MTLPVEILYKAILGFPSHQVGSDGSLWTKTKFGPKMKGEKRGIWRRMSVNPDKDGYLNTCTVVNRARKMLKVHICVLEAFIGPKPDGCQGCHNDGNPGNNIVSNLRWDTCVNNNLDKKKHGTYQACEKGSHAKLTAHQVRVIRRNGHRWGWQTKLAKLYKVSVSTVGKAYTGKNWSTLDE